MNMSFIDSGKRAGRALGSAMFDELDNWKRVWLKPGKVPFCDTDKQVLGILPFGFLNKEQDKIVRCCDIHEPAHAILSLSQTEMKKYVQSKGKLEQFDLIFKVNNHIEDRRIEQWASNRWAGAGASLREGNIVMAGEWNSNMSKPNINIGDVRQALVWLSFQDEGISVNWTPSEKALEYIKLVGDKFHSWRKLPDVNVKAGGWSVLDLSMEIVEMLIDKKKQDNKEEQQDKQEQKQDKQEQKQDKKQDKQDKKQGKSEQSEQGEQSEEQEEQGGGSSDMDDELDKLADDKDEEKDGENEDSKDEDSEESEDEDSKDSSGKSDGDDEEEDEDSKDGSGDSEDSDDEEEDDEDSKGEGKSDSDDEDEDGEEDSKGGSDSDEDEDESKPEDGDDEKGEDEGSSNKGGNEDSEDEENEDSTASKNDMTDKEAIDSLKDETDGEDLSETLERMTAEISENSLADDEDHYTADTTRDVWLTAESNPNAYEQAKSEISCSVAKLTRYIENALQSVARSKKLGDRDRGHLDKKKLHLVAKSLSKKIFYKVRDGRELNTCVSIVIDESGSMMERSAYVEVRSLAIALGECLSKLNIPFEIAGFSTTGDIDNSIPSFITRTNPIMAKLYKSFGESYQAVRTRLGSILYYNNHIDGEALEMMAYRMAVRKEKRKILFALSDGEPYAGQGDRQVFERNLIKVCERLRNTGFEVYGFGVNTYAPKKYYGEKNFVYLESTKNMGMDFLSRFFQIIGKGMV